MISPLLCAKESPEARVMTVDVGAVAADLDGVERRDERVRVAGQGQRKALTRPKAVWRSASTSMVHRRTGMQRRRV